MSSVLTPEPLSAILATRIEREDGLPCGRCGGCHVETWREMESAEHPCTCWCCHGALVEMVEGQYPDLITTVDGVRVVTNAAFGEAIRRIEAEIASLERVAAD